MTSNPEGRIDELEKRVDWIERYLGRQTAPTIVPPPIIQPAAALESSPRENVARRCPRCGYAMHDSGSALCDRCLAASAQASATAGAAPSAPRVTFTQAGADAGKRTDTEFILGARILPRIGAVLVLLGLAFFAGWAYTNGLITPWLAFLGEVGVSVAFLATGFGLSKTKEQFGEVLKAVGSAGLFTSLAAGHLYHHVFNAEAMLGGCLLLSIGNMAYAAVVKSKSFWGLGLVGGLITALMPLNQNQILTSETLLSMVMATSLVSAGIHKWMKAILGSWTVFACLQVAFVQSDLPWLFRVGHLEGVALLAILSYGYAFWQKNPFDPKAIAPAVMGIGAGILGFYVKSGPMGSLHAGLLGAAIGIFAVVNSKKPNLQSSLIFTAGALLLALCPFGLQSWFTSAFMIALAYLLLAAEMRFKKVELCWLAAFEVAAASVVAMARFNDFSRDIHLMLNGAMLLALIPMAVAFRRHYTDDSPIFTGHGWAGLYYTTVIGVLLDHANPPIGMPLTIAWTSYGLGLLLLGIMGKLREVRIAGILVLLGTLAKVVFYDLSSIELIAKVAVLTGLGLAMLVGGYLVIRLRGSDSGNH